MRYRLGTFSNFQRIFFRDLMDKGGYSSALGIKFFGQPSLHISFPVKGDKDISPIKVSYFFHSICPFPMVIDVSRPRRGSKKVIIFNIKVEKIFAFSFFQKLLRSHVPSIVGRDGSYQLTFDGVSQKLGFYSKNLFDFDFYPKRYDFFGWRAPVSIFFPSKGKTFFSLFKIKFSKKAKVA